MTGPARTRSTVPLTRAGWVVTLLLLLAVCGAFAQDAFFHTDDGCAVEIHCTACLWAQTATSPGLSLRAPVPVLESSGTVEVASVRRHEQGPRAVGPARAPPLA
jgi:hypothetical protein